MKFGASFLVAPPPTSSGSGSLMSVGRSNRNAEIRYDTYYHLLRRLKIHMAVFDDSHELKTILENLPSLTHLLLNNTIFDLEIFRDLRHNEILPRLEVDRKSVV